ncbi:MAG: hypothetical protein ACOY3I_00860 [Verrucomicrobiota bacterium]
MKIYRVYLINGACVDVQGEEMDRSYAQNELQYFYVKTKEGRSETVFMANQVAAIICKDQLIDEKIAPQ